MVIGLFLQIMGLLLRNMMYNTMDFIIKDVSIAAITAFILVNFLLYLVH